MCEMTQDLTTILISHLDRFTVMDVKLKLMWNCYFVFQVDITELCPSATVLAQQLTHVELERLSYIGPEEFVQAFAKVSVLEKKKKKKTQCFQMPLQSLNKVSL